ncbi:MAG: aminotransferase class V-fold PLP-dependent enzyme [Chloroflexia bacterium]
MTASTAITFKTATESWEFEQISILNYRTFVEEIPQHEADDSGVRVDPFHPENTYVIALRGRDLIGMIAVRDTRPFSLDLKLPNLDSYLPPASSICELRLLAVHPDHRNGVVFRGMGRVLRKHCLEQGYDLAIMSGTVRQKKLYSSLGFEAFGPLVGSPSAPFQPMYLTPERFVTKQQLFTPPTGRKQPVNFLPGPVESSPEVHRAFRADSVSHRAERFMQDFEEMRASLAKFVNARHVQILLGSGTLANDAVGACISLLGTRGVVLSNGEFGRRLVDQATRFGMRFDTVEVEWGDAFDYSDVERALSRLPSGGWLWAVHCETSTGVLNDLDVLKAICKRHDATSTSTASSLGTGRWTCEVAAAFASGKGLGAYPGLSMVFHEHDAVPSTSPPRYLDLGLYELPAAYRSQSSTWYTPARSAAGDAERSGSG